MRYVPGHPLAPPSAVVAASRLALYAKIGAGSHACHWCGATVQWRPGEGLKPDALIADHLDWDSHNDAPENLVPSCNGCNGHRRRAGDSRRIRPGEPVLLVRGRPTRAIERECAGCGRRFLALPAHVRKGKARFCSRSCMYARGSAQTRD